RDLDPPAAGHDRPPVRALEPLHVPAPEGQPHLPYIRIGRQRSPFGRIERPVLARAPRAAELVAGGPEVETGPAAHDHVPLPGQERMHPERPPAVLEGERARVLVERAPLADAPARLPGRVLDLRLGHAVEEPRLLVRRVPARDAVEDE